MGIRSLKQNRVKGHMRLWMRSQVGYCTHKCFENCKMRVKLLGCTETGQVHSAEKGCAFGILEKRGVAGWRKGFIGEEVFHRLGVVVEWWFEWQTKTKPYFAGNRKLAKFPEWDERHVAGGFCTANIWWLVVGEVMRRELPSGALHKQPEICKWNCWEREFVWDTFSAWGPTGCSCMCHVNVLASLSSGEALGQWRVKASTNASLFYCSSG